MTDEMTFAQAAEAHLDDVYGYLAWFTGDRAAAEDLAGETFERAVRVWARFDARPGPGALSRPDRGAPRREQLAAVPERFDEQYAEGLSHDLQAALGVLTAG